MTQQVHDMEGITRYGDSIPKDMIEKYPNNIPDVSGNYFSRKMKTMFKTPSKIYFGSEWNVCDRESYDSIRCLAIVWNEIDQCVRRRITKLKIMDVSYGRYNDINRTITLNIDCLLFSEVFDLIHHEIGHYIDAEHYGIMTDEIALRLIGMTEHASKYHLDSIISYGDEYPTIAQCNGKYSRKWKKEIFAEVYRLWMLERHGMILNGLVSIDKYKLAKELFEPIFERAHSE